MVLAHNVITYRGQWEFSNIPFSLARVSVTLTECCLLQCANARFDRVCRFFLLSFGNQFAPLSRDGQFILSYVRNMPEQTYSVLSDCFCFGVFYGVSYLGRRLHSSAPPSKVQTYWFRRKASCRRRVRVRDRAYGSMSNSVDWSQRALACYKYGCVASLGAKDRRRFRLTQNGNYCQQSPPALVGTT